VRVADRREVAFNLTLVGLPGDTSELYIDAGGLMRREQPGSRLYEAAVQDVRNMERTILEVLEDRRRTPRNDVATVIARIKVDGAPAPFELLHNLLETVVSGGVSTTVPLIAHALLWLPAEPSVVWLPVTFTPGALVGATRPTGGPALPDRVVI